MQEIKGERAEQKIEARECSESSEEEVLSIDEEILWNSEKEL